jgi:predicted nuclease with TOPRIM domain
MANDKHEREPIKHTCPDIDRYIKLIRSEIVRRMDLQGLNEEQLFDTAMSMSDQLENCVGYLEELRSSNHELRMWGVDEANAVDELQSELDELKETSSII